MQQMKVIFGTNSIQILKIHTNSNIPYFFGTVTMLDTHFIYLTTKKSTFHYFLIYVKNLIRKSEWFLLNFYLIDCSLQQMVSCVQ